jgi:hypothetical protein
LSQDEGQSHTSQIVTHSKGSEVTGSARITVTVTLIKRAEVRFKVTIQKVTQNNRSEERVSIPKVAFKCKQSLVLSLLYVNFRINPSFYVEVVTFGLW